MPAAQEFSDPAAAALLAAFALVFALLTWMHLRGLRKPGAPTRCAEPILGRDLSAYGLSCLALAVMALIEAAGS